ncbi:hypothetical protein ACH4S9_37125 [Streptomyces sp. NPDC021225]|uniref:hypothetical protein n=1 Tax=Streptomyces sp. NPDC021225 TaxID=3365121 RepID=UPI0037989FC3
MRYAWSRTTGRRGTAIASSAAALCLGALLSGCAGGDDGYLAAEAAGPDAPRATSAPPRGDVELVPLDGDGNGNGTGKGSGRDGKRRPSGAGGTGAPSAPGASPRPDGSAATPTPGESPGRDGDRADSPPDGASDGSGSGGSGTPGSSSGPTDPGGSGGGSAPPQSTPGSPSTPSGPAELTLGELVRTAADDRWCEKVTVEFRNTGGAPVTSGTITFATHIIDALGIDWATIESKRDLPVPIGTGEKKEKTWEVCVDDWRVPLGMHIETRTASATWPGGQAESPPEDQATDETGDRSGGWAVSGGS